MGQKRADMLCSSICVERYYSDISGKKVDNQGVLRQFYSVVCYKKKLSSEKEVLPTSVKYKEGILFGSL